MTISGLKLLICNPIGSISHPQSLTSSKGYLTPSNIHRITIKRIGWCSNNHLTKNVEKKTSDKFKQLTKDLL